MNPSIEEVKYNKSVDFQYINVNNKPMKLKDKIRKK